MLTLIACNLIMQNWRLIQVDWPSRMPSTRSDESSVHFQDVTVFRLLVRPQPEGNCSVCPLTLLRSFAVVVCFGPVSIQVW